MCFPLSSLKSCSLPLNSSTVTRSHYQIFYSLILTVSFSEKWNKQPTKHVYGVNRTQTSLGRFVREAISYITWAELLADLWDLVLAISLILKLVWSFLLLKKVMKAFICAWGSRWKNKTKCISQPRSLCVLYLNLLFLSEVWLYFIAIEGRVGKVEMGVGWYRQSQIT